MADLTVSLLAPVVRTSKVVHADQVVSNFLLTSQRFLGLEPTFVRREEMLLCLGINSECRDPYRDHLSEWIDPVRFRGNRSSAIAPSSCEVNLVSSPSNGSRRVAHG